MLCARHHVVTPTWYTTDENKVAICAAGAAPPLVALLASPSSEMQGAAVEALGNLAGNCVWLLLILKSFLRNCFILSIMCTAAANKIAIATAGAVPPLIALLSSPSIDLQRTSAGVLWRLSVNGERGRQCDDESEIVA